MISGCEERARWASSAQLSFTAPWSVDAALISACEERARNASRALNRVARLKV